MNLLYGQFCAFISDGHVGGLEVHCGLFDFVQVTIFSSPDLHLLEGHIREDLETYDCDHLIQHRGPLHVNSWTAG